MILGHTRAPTVPKFFKNHPKWGPSSKICLNYIQKFLRELSKFLFESKIYLRLSSRFFLEKVNMFSSQPNLFRYDLVFIIIDLRKIVSNIFKKKFLQCCQKYQRCLCLFILQGMAIWTKNKLFSIPRVKYLHL